MIPVDLDFLVLLLARTMADRKGGAHFISDIDVQNDNKEVGHRCEAGYGIHFPEAIYVGDKEWRYDYIHSNYYPIPFVDVKGRRCKRKPESDYWVNIRSPDMERGKGVIYCFAFNDIIKNRIWLVGWIEADVFAREADFFPAGSHQPDTHMLLYHDTYSMRINQLNSYERG